MVHVVRRGVTKPAAVPGIFEGSSGADRARPSSGSPTPATSAVPTFGNRRRLGSCRKHLGVEAGSLVGASLAREAARVTVADIHLRRKCGEFCTRMRGLSRRQV
jgi:hypothetical protein